MQDADQAGIALIDIGSGSAKQQKQSYSWAAVDKEHFRSHPGLNVLQLAWHPGVLNSGIFTVPPCRHMYGRLRLQPAVTQGFAAPDSDKDKQVP